MQVVGVKSAGVNYEYKWPETTEIYESYVDYETLSEDGTHVVRIGYCTRHVYGKDRMRVVVWVDGHPHAEFVGTDDFNKSGEVLSEIKLPSKGSTRMCRYPDAIMPERYRMFNVCGIPTRIVASGVHNAWAVVANISDHRAMIALASLRMLERKR